MTTPPATTSGATSGRIITFYSYKGGTGRSMMLANCAWLLATAGRRVLVVDWDLEAPGLQRYFAPFLTNPALTDADGLIDLVVKYSAAAVDPTAKDRPKDWYLEYADVLDYAISINWKFPNGGSLALMPSGRQGPTYATRVNSFSWQHFYDKLGGHALFEALKDSMRQFDFVLIDSRTGVSDTSGITTVQFPDSLVVLFTLNNQSIDGASAITRSVLQQHKKGFSVFPLPTRVDNSESDRLKLRWELALSTFKQILGSDSPTQDDEYWDQHTVPYIPKFAYEELLAPFANRMSDPAQLNLLKVAVRVVKTVFGVRVQPEDYKESVRQNALEFYAGRGGTMTPAEAQRAAEAEQSEVEAKTQNAVDQARSEVQGVARRQIVYIIVAATALVVLLASIFMYRSALTASKQVEVTENIILGDRAFQAGKFAAALQSYNLAVAADPANTAVLSGRAQVYLKLDQPALAMADLDRAIEARPEDANLRVVRAGAYEAQSQNDKAEAELDYIQTSLKAESAVQNQMAQLYETLGSLQKADSAYSTVLTSNPNNTEALSARARVLLKLGDERGAWADLRRIISLDPGSPLAAQAGNTFDNYDVDPNGKPSSAVPTLYIQYSTARDLPLVEEISSNFKTARVNVPGAELRKGTGGAEVRYFFDDDLESAQQVDRIVKRVLASMRNAVVIRVTRVQANSAKPGQIELWLPAISRPTLSTVKVEVFWCVASGSQARNMANQIVKLKPSSATGRWKTEQLAREQSQRDGYGLAEGSKGFEIRFETADEVDIAKELQVLLTNTKRFPPFELIPVTGRPTADYISVFICPSVSPSAAKY